MYLVMYLFAALQIFVSTGYHDPTLKWHGLLVPDVVNVFKAFPHVDEAQLRKRLHVLTEYYAMFKSCSGYIRALTCWFTLAVTMFPEATTTRERSQWSLFRSNWGLALSKSSLVAANGVTYHDKRGVWFLASHPNWEQPFEGYIFAWFNKDGVATFAFNERERVVFYDNLEVKYMYNEDGSLCSILIGDAHIDWTREQRCRYFKRKTPITDDCIRYQEWDRGGRKRFWAYFQEGVCVEIHDKGWGQQLPPFVVGDELPADILSAFEEQCPKFNELARQKIL